jgi:phosphomannomutase
MAYEGLMVSVSGVRGRVGEALSPEVVARFAAAFGAWSIARPRADGGAPSRAIVLGRDSRVSGPLFHRVASAALESVGAEVIDIGLTTTPTCQLAVEHHHAAGGLMLSASHNPIEWNALKFIGSSGLFLEAYEGAAMRAAMEHGIAYATWDRLGATHADAAAARRHLDAVLALPFLDVAGIRARRFRVVLDCCNGAGAVILPALLEALGCEVSAINMEPDGRFPRAPEPVAANLGEVEALVARVGAAVGFVTDPDVLRHRRGVVVTNLSTSRIVDDMAEAAGSRVIRAPVGEVNVAVRMREERAVLGGEGNGGVILPELHLGRDAPLGVALILQLLHEEGRPLSAVIADHPRYAIVKDKLDRPPAPLDAVYAALRAEFADAEADTQDGLRLSWPDRWVHVRPSGTEPIVRVIAEGPDAAAAQALVDRSRAPLDALVAATAVAGVA